MNCNSNLISYDKAPYYVRIVKFICDICGRKWNSASGNLEDYQICKNCSRECYPVSYKFEAPSKRGNQNRETYECHKSELCGKCIRLGHSCMNLGQGSGLTMFNDEGEEVTLCERNLSTFMHIENNMFNDARSPNASKPNRNIIDITRDDEFPPLTDIHIRKEKPASFSSDSYHNVHTNLNNASDDYYRYLTEKYHSNEDIEFEEHDLSENSWYANDSQIGHNSWYLGGGESDNQSECISYISPVEDTTECIKRLTLHDDSDEAQPLLKYNMDLPNEECI